MHPAFSTATFSASSAAFSFSCRLNHRLLYPSSSYERRATPVHPRPSLRAAPRHSAPKKARLAKGRPASWRSLADQYPPPRTRTDGHACARCGPLSFSFFPLFRFGTALPPFSARLCRSPIPLFCPSVPFLVSQPRSLFLFFRPPPSSPLAPPVTLASFPTPRLCLSFSHSPRPFSLVISSSFALSIFLLLLSPFPLIFPLSYACLLSFFRSPTTHRFFSFNPFRSHRSIFLPFVPLYISPPPP